MPIAGIGSAAAEDAVAALTTALASASSTYASLNPAVSSYTYNSDGSVATETVASVTTTYTYNTDGTVATSVRAGVTRTYTYNSDGTLASVA